MAKIIVIGLGVVGMVHAIHLSLANRVTGVDTSVDRVRDAKTKGVFAVSDSSNVYSNDVDFVFICLPTDWDDNLCQLDSTLVENEVRIALRSNPNAVIVVRSTLPVGCLSSESRKFVYCPEFLRASNVEQDFLTSDLILAGKSEQCNKVIEVLKSVRIVDTEQVFVKSLKEVQAIKLFRNAYLATRIAYFSALDNYCKSVGIDTDEVIHGVCMDKRIGNWYNTPGNGDLGHCLSKDTRQVIGQMSSADGGILFDAALNISDARCLAKPEVE